jgi:hypothetical protein
MQYSSFLSLIMGFKKISEDCSELHDIGLDVMDGKYKMTETVEKILSGVFTGEYGEEGWEWVSWFIFESDYGRKDWSASPCYDSEGNLLYEKGEVRYGAIGENGNPICYSYESTWEYLEKNHRISSEN